jgi:hypothetical protein
MYGIRICPSVYHQREAWADPVLSVPYAAADAADHTAPLPSPPTDDETALSPFRPYPEPILLLPSLNLDRIPAPEI